MCDHPGSRSFPRRIVATSAWSQSQFLSQNRCDRTGWSSASDGYKGRPCSVCFLRLSLSTAVPCSPLVMAYPQWDRSRRLVTRLICATTWSIFSYQKILSQIRPHVANSLLSECFGLCSYGKSSIAYRSAIRHTHD